MAYSNFIGDVWAKAIERERDRFCVGASLSDRSHESDAVEFGKSVIVNFTKRPEVKNYVAGTAITGAETLDGSSKTIAINQSKYVNFMVDDVDELQSRPNIMESCMKEAAAAIAEDMDNYIYKLHAGAGSTITEAAVTSANITAIISDAAKKLYESNVPMNEEISLEVSPAIYQKLWLAKILRVNPNEKVFDTGYVGMVDNFKVYMTNGIQMTGAVHHCIARTKKAIAVIGQMKKMEAYRPQGAFADAVKGLHVYGGAIVRANEMVRLNLTPAVG